VAETLCCIFAFIIVRTVDASDVELDESSEADHVNSQCVNHQKGSDAVQEKNRDYCHTLNANQNTGKYRMVLIIWLFHRNSTGRSMRETGICRCILLHSSL